MGEKQNQSYCRYCGNLIDGDSTFCIYCGAKVSYKENLHFDKAEKIILSLAKIVLGPILAGLISLILFSLAYLLFHNTLRDYREWMWNFSFTAGIAYLLGALLCHFTNIKPRKAAYIIIPILMLTYGIMIFVRYCQDCAYEKENQKEEIYHSAADTATDDSYSSYDNNINNSNILPTQEDINAVNEKLPILVAKNTLLSYVSYDEATMTQIFYYDFTKVIDESIITPEFINQCKKNIIQTMENMDEYNTTNRLRAGVTDLFVYRSVDGRVLYKIQIDSYDLLQ